MGQGKRTGLLKKGISEAAHPELPLPAQRLILLRTSDQAHGLCVAQSLGCLARLPLLTCQSFALWPGPRCPSSSLAPLTQSWVWGRVLSTTVLGEEGLTGDL